MKKIKYSLTIVLAISATILLVNRSTNENENKFISFEDQREINFESLPEGFFDQDEDAEGPTSENPIERLDFEKAMLADPRTGEIPRDILQRELAYAKSVLNAKNNEAPYGVNPFSRNSQPTSTSENSENFINMGPYNVGGRTRAVEIDENDENTILAGGISGGIWKSTDQGQSWTRTSGLQQHPAVTSLVQDRRDGKTNVWYYSTGENIGNSASDPGAFYLGNGIYKSTDNGDSWSLITSTAQSGTSGTDVITSSERFTIIDELAIDYSEEGGTEIYASGLSEVIRSTDGFETFQVVLGADNTGENFTDIAISSSGMVYATIGNSSNNGGGAEDGIFKSDDGISWTQIEPATNFPSSFTRIEIGIDPNNENRVYFVSGDQLFLYEEDTDTWSELTDNIKVTDSDVGQGHWDQGGYDLYVAVHPTKEDIIFLGGVNLMRTVDGFATEGNTRQIGGYANDNNPNNFPRYPNHHPDNHDFAFFDSDPDRMISATDGGLHITEDNSNPGSSTSSVPVIWSSLNNGYITAQFYHASIQKNDLGDQQLMGGMQDNGTWAKFEEDPEEEWQEVFSGDGAYTAINYNSLIVSSQRGNVGRYGLVNNTYEYAGGISPSSSDNEFLFINPFFVNPVQQDQMFVAAAGKVYYTNDVSQNPGVGEWNELTNNDLATQRVSAFGQSVEPEGTLYIGTRSSRVYKVENSQELTGDAEVITVTRPGGTGNISSISVDPKDADRVILTVSNYNAISIWYSEDGGDTWNSIGGNLEENPDGSGDGPSVRASAIMPDGSGGYYYFVGTSVGLFMTKTLDGDNTVWSQQASQVIGNVVVANIEARPIEGMVMVSTHGNGAFFGFYETGIVPNINYSVSEDGLSYTLRANKSFIQGSGMAYEWLKDGQVIDGATQSELVVVDGGDYQVRLQIEGVDGSGLSNIVSINLDGQGPVISSISRFNPVTENIDVNEVVFEVTFDENVVNIGTDDFETTGQASGTIASVVATTGTNVFRVTVDGIGGAGTLGLGLVSASDITDEVGNAFTGTIESAETYTVTDNTAPTVAITRSNPTSETTNENSVDFLIEFTEDVQNVDVSDFVLANSFPNSEMTIAPLSGTRSFVLNVSQIISDGTVDIDIAPGQNIADGAGNAFDGTITSEETFIIQNVIASIEGSGNRSYSEIWVDTNPSNGQFILILPDGFSGTIEFNIVDANGRSLESEAVNNYIPGQRIDIDLRNESDGLYIFEAAGANGRASTKLLKRNR